MYDVFTKLIWNKAYIFLRVFDIKNTFSININRSVFNVH